MSSETYILCDLKGQSTTRRSRRWLLERMGKGGGAMLFAAGALGTVGRLGAAAAEPATAAADQPATAAIDVPAFFQEFLDAWATAAQTGDPAGVLPFYTEDARLEDAPLGLTFRGLAEIEPFLTGFFGNYSDASLAWQSAFATATGGGAETLFQGNYTGHIFGLPPGTGQPLVVRGAHIYEFAGDQIKRQTLYFDSYGFLIQLGVLPAPES